jgi:hypothetical protein
MRRMALALALLLLLPSCENSDRISEVPVDQNKSFIGSFTPTSWSVVSGGMVGLNATVVNPLNEPLSNRAVEFEILSGPGALSVAADTTGDQGAVQTLFMTQEGDIGATMIRAQTGDSHKDLIVQVTAPGGPGDGDTSPAFVELSANPTSLLGNGLTSSAVTASVTDGLHAPVSDGTVVKFAAGERFEDTDGDGYFTEGVDEILDDADGDGQWDAIGSIDFVASTQGGVVVVTYDAPEDTGTVYIKATAGEVSEDITVELLPVPGELNIASIVLVSPSPTLQVKATGGVESTPAIAYGYDALGQPVGANWEISFEVIHGPGGGEGLEEAGYGPVSYFTDDYGKAAVSVTSGTVSGTMYVRARCGDVYSGATQIAISAGPPAYISLGVNPGNIRGWDIEHARAAVSALVGDQYHNPVPDNTAVYFTVDEGTIVGIDDSGVSFTEAGFAEANFFSGDPRGDGIVEITAQTSGGEVVGTTHLITSGPPAYVYILQYPSNIRAAAGSEGDIVVRVLDVNNNYVVEGTLVRFDIDYGSVTPTAVTSDGLYDSIAEGTVYSEILDADYSMPGPADDGVGAIATLTAGSMPAYGASTSANVQFTTGLSRNDRSFVTMPQNIPAGADVPLYITIKDREGNPLGDHTVSLSVTSGSVDPSVVTNTLGEALINFASPDTSAEVTLTARDTDPNYGGVVLFVKILVD